MTTHTSSSTSTGVAVVGSGRAVAPPDLALIRLAAECVDSTVQRALDRAARAFSAMRSAVLEAGVGVEDLQSAGTTVHVNHGPDGRAAGFMAHLGLAVTVRDVAAAGSTASAALGAGGDASRLEGLRVSHDDPVALRVIARERAFADAQAKAQQFATLAGRRLGVVVDVSEQLGGMRVIPMAASASFGAEMSVEPGTEEVRAEVYVRWEWAG